MAGYVDLYLLPIRRRQLAAYRKVARTFGAVVADHGALEYREFVASGAKPMKGVMPVERLLRPRKGEVLVFSVLGFKSKKHREAVYAKSMKDPRMKRLMQQTPAFDMKRMYLSEFETFVGSAPL
jgi:uncharacterized protein YbaA (DUF1428 family)